MIAHFEADLQKLYELGLDRLRWPHWDHEVCLAPPNAWMCPTTVLVMLVQDECMMPVHMGMLGTPPPRREPRIAIVDGGLLGRRMVNHSCSSVASDAEGGIVADPPRGCGIGPVHLFETCSGTRASTAVWVFLRLWMSEAVDGLLPCGWRHRMDRRAADEVAELLALEGLAEWAPTPDGKTCGVEGCSGMCGATLRPTARGAGLLADAGTMV